MSTMKSSKATPINLQQETQSSPNSPVETPKRHGSLFKLFKKRDSVGGTSLTDLSSSPKSGVGPHPSSG